MVWTRPSYSSRRFRHFCEMDPQMSECWLEVCTGRSIGGRSILDSKSRLLKLCCYYGWNMFKFIRLKNKAATVGFETLCFLRSKKFMFENLLEKFLALNFWHWQGAILINFLYKSGTITTRRYWSFCEQKLWGKTRKVIQRSFAGKCFCTQAICNVGLYLFEDLP